MKYIQRLVVLFLLLGIGGLPGCNNEGNGRRVQEAPDLPRGDGNLYVVNEGTGSVVAFDTASSAEGDLSPDRHFPETIASPTGLFLDQTTDTLYVANTGEDAIPIYENAGLLELPDGMASADRVISGPKTGLRLPNGIAYDATRQRLYVTNEGNASILVFQPDCPVAASLNGDIAPCRVISGPSTLLDAPGELALDSARDILYISNEGAESILAYENASQASIQGDIAPTRTISSIQSPAGIFIDSANDRLYAVQTEGQPAVLVYENASTRSGQTSPDRTLTGQNTLLVSPLGIDVDIDQNLIYVVNNDHPPDGDNALLIFSDPFANCAVCDVAPARIIIGDETGLTDATDIAVDSRIDRIYVSNTLDNAILLFEMGGNIAPIKINTGANTRLEQPVSFFYDSGLDRLYVANHFFSAASSPAITVYDQVSSTAFENTPPSWSLTDPALSLPRAFSIYTDPNGRILLLILDSSRLRIYDPDNTLDNILSGAAPSPSGTISLSPFLNTTLTTGINRPRAMAVDPIKGEVYIANNPTSGSRNIAVFDLKDLTNTSPIRTIIGANTQIVSPFGLFIDTRRDILYVTDLGSHTVLVFEEASGKSGDIAPDRVLTSQTLPSSDKLATPTAPFMNIEKDRLFLINRGNDSVYIYDHASDPELTGEVAPDRKLVGDETQLAFSDATDAFTGALWVDTTRGGERLFVGGPRDPRCTPPLSLCPRGAFLLFSVEGNTAPNQVWSGGEHRLVGPSAVAVDPRRDLLYVANQGDPAVTSDDSISLFTKASRSDGNSPLTGTVSVTQGVSTVIGTGTLFTTELALGDQIKVGSTMVMVSSISSDTTLSLVAPYPEETGSGLIAVRPPKILCSPSGTTCASPDAKLNNPAGLAVDHEQNRLYVSNSGTTDCSDATPCNSVLVFHAASSFTNNAVPAHTITDGALNSPRGLDLDIERGILYVANYGNNSILAFRLEEKEEEECRTKQKGGEIGGGRPAFLTCVQEELKKPDAEIFGAATGISKPVGVAIDWAEDLLYVLNEGSAEILVFEQASTLNGDRAPARTFSGASDQNPSALFLDVEGDLLYAATPGGNAVYIFANASRAEGEAAHKTITGLNTGLDQPVGLAVDTAR